MNAKANYVRSRLSLRSPQAESLEILQELTDVLELKKGPDLVTELAKVHERKPWKYLLIPHDAVMLNMSFDGLALNYEVEESP